MLESKRLSCDGYSGYMGRRRDWNMIRLRDGS
jgi:hypothetical protein